VDGLPAFLFLEGNRNFSIGGKAHSIAFDIGDQFEGDEVVMPLVTALPAVLLGQLDAVAFDVINCADMNAVGSDDFGMFLDSRCIDHGQLLLFACLQRTKCELDAARRTLGPNGRVAAAEYLNEI
jgi:hypothetical protein